MQIFIPVPRAIALERGLDRYYSGKPCPKGHLAERHTLKSSCVACAAEKSRAFKFGDFEPAAVMEASRLYVSGLTIPQVAAQMGCGKNKAAAMLRQAGVQMRGQTEYHKLETDDDAIRRAYECGETVGEIARRLSIGFGTVQRRLAASGADMRKNSWNKFDHLVPEIRRLYLVEKLSCKAIAQMVGVNYTTVLRYLRTNDVPVRADSSVQVYSHESPSAGVIRVRGTWELCYAKVLDAWFAEGKIKSWAYEPERIDTSRFGFGSHYVPDFRITPHHGAAVFHEVKGYMREHSARKLRLLREAGITIVLIKGRILQALCSHYGIKIDTKGAN